MDEQKNSTVKKFVVIVFILLLLIGMFAGIYAYTPEYTSYLNQFPVQVMPKVNGNLKPNTEFDYNFVFATDENCVYDVYTKAVTITTDKYGVGSTILNLSSVTQIPKYLCEYRDGSLRKVHPLNERLFLKQINDQDILNYGFIKNYTDTSLNESQVDNFVSNNGYLTNETDPTIDLQKLQNLTFNDFHNLGGIDRVLNESEIQMMGFLQNETDYCKDGICNGDLTINGDLTVIGSLANLSVTNVNTNGSIIPSFNNMFNLGDVGFKWNTIYASVIDANIDYSKIQNVPNFLLTETDPEVGTLINGQWCRVTGSQVVCDVAPVVDTTLSDSDISNMGYIKTFTETDPIFTSSPSFIISNLNITNWNSAYSWGNHQNYGYITDPDDEVDSNELDNICNQNNMILKRINNTWGCSNESLGFIPTSLLVDYNFTDGSINWNKVYNDYYNNTNEYLTNETDPIFTQSASYQIANSNISNWNVAYSWGNHNLIGYLTNETDPIFTASPSYNITNSNISNWQTAFNWGDHSLVGYLTNYTETDPLYIADKNGIVFLLNTTDWDKNSSDDFDGNWGSLNAIPVGFLDGIDNDTQYFNLSEFNNDVGYLTSFSETDPIYISEKANIIFINDTLLWDKNSSDDFDGNWGSLNAIPNDFADNIDNDTKYYNLSEFTNDVGYLTSFSENDPIFSASDVANVSSIDISNWNLVYYDYYNNTFGYLTSETDPVFIASPSYNIQNSNISNWNTAFGWGDHSLVGYLTNFSENDPQYNADKNDIIFDNETTNWDKNANDDFDGNWGSLTNIPSDIADGDNDTKYYNLSELNNDVGYLTSFNESDPVYISEKNGIVFYVDTNIWDKNYTDDFNGEWSNLLSVPLDLLDGDNDTQYYNLSEFNNDVGFITSFSETDPLFNSEKTNYVLINSTTLWDKDYTDDFNGSWYALTSIPTDIADGDNNTQYFALSEFTNDVGFITSFNETDPLFIASPSSNITYIVIDNWNQVFNDYYNNTNEYLTSFSETDPIFNSEKINYVLFNSTTLWDTDYTDDFNGNWSDINGIPLDLLDGDNDTKYYNLSEFANDVGYLTVFSELDPQYNNDKNDIIFENKTTNWDKNVSDDFDYQWSSLLNVPNDIVDGDNDTKYYNLSEFTNDVGYITNYVDTVLNESQVDDYVSNNGYLTSFNESDPVFSASPSFGISNLFIGNWNQVFNDYYNNTNGYLTSFSETDPLFSASDVANVSLIDISNWQTAFGWGDHSLVGYLTNYTETDPLFIVSPSYNIQNSNISNWNYVYNQVNAGGNSSLVFMNNTTNWDKNVSDDFSGNWSSLIGVPSGFADGIDNNTIYTNVSQLYNDVGYYKSGDNVIFNNINSSNLYVSNVYALNDMEVGSSITVGGQNVCLADGTNCDNIISTATTTNINKLLIDEEFIATSTETGEIGSLGWAVSLTGGGTMFYENTISNLNSNHQGVLVCAGSDTSSGCKYDLGSYIKVGGNEKFGTILNSNDLTYTVFRVGLINTITSANSNIVDGIYFELSPTSSYIIGASERDNVRTTCDMILVSDYTWYQLEFKLNSDATQIDFYANNVLACSITTNIPTDESIGPMLTGYNFANPSGTPDIVEYDKVWFEKEVIDNRFD